MATCSARTIDVLSGPQAGDAAISADAAQLCAEAAAQRGTPVLRQALGTAAVPAIELSRGDIHADDEFSYHSPAAKTILASLTGFGLEGYRLAISGLAAGIGATAIA